MVKLDRLRREGGPVLWSQRPAGLPRSHSWSMQRPGFLRWSRSPFRPSSAQDKPGRGTSRRGFSLCLALSPPGPSATHRVCGAFSGAWQTVAVPHLAVVVSSELLTEGRGCLYVLSLFLGSWCAGEAAYRVGAGGTLRLRCGWSLSPPTRERLGTLGAHDSPTRLVQGHLCTPALEMDHSPGLRDAHAHLLHLHPLGWGLIGVPTPL